MVRGLPWPKTHDFISDICFNKAALPPTVTVVTDKQLVNRRRPAGHTFKSRVV